MKLITAVFAATLCVGWAASDLALAQGRNSERGRQLSESDKAPNASSKAGRPTSSKSSKHAAAKRHAAAKPAQRGQTKSRAGSRTQQGTASRPVWPQAAQEDIPAAKPSIAAGSSSARPGVARQGRRVSDGKAKGNVDKPPSCLSAGRGVGACPNEIADNAAALPRPELTRNEQIRRTKALAKLYMQKAK